MLQGQASLRFPEREGEGLPGGDCAGIFGSGKEAERSTPEAYQTYVTKATVRADAARAEKDQAGACSSGG